MRPDSTQAVTVKAALSGAALKLESSTSPQLDCQILLAHVLGVERSWLYAHDDDVLDAGVSGRFDKLVSRRQRGEPVAYLTGHQGFWTMDLEVSPATLIPRPDTERLIEVTLDELSAEDPLHVADLGTGSGAIAIALGLERPAWQLIATDVSPDALAVAERNAAKAGCNNLSFRRADWLDGFDTGSLDAIVSNPPYIESGDPHLTQLQYEPEGALVSGEDGLDAIRCIVASARDILKVRGTLIIEHGYNQQPAVTDIMQRSGFTGISTFSDSAGNPRVTLGKKP